MGDLPPINQEHEIDVGPNGWEFDADQSPPPSDYMPGMGPNPSADLPTPDGPPPVSEEVAEFGGGGGPGPGPGPGPMGGGGPGPGPGPDGPGEMDEAGGPALEQDNGQVSSGYYDEPAPAHES